MSDIVERLKKHSDNFVGKPFEEVKNDLTESAETIEKLRAENEEHKRLLKTQKGITDTIHKQWRVLVSDFNELKKANEWQPIDSAPKGVNVMLWFISVKPENKSTHCASMGSICWDEEGDEFYNKVWTGCGYSPLEAYTHWKPLPSAPK